jgi:thiamine biosynthesis lipoprotein
LSFLAVVLRATVLLTLLLGFATGCAHRAPLERYEFQRPQMGMPFRIVLYAHDATMATNVAEAVWARIAELNSILSDYDENSELSRLSRTGGSSQRVMLSGDLGQVLGEAERISRASDGAFDVTVGPFVQLWKRARRQRELPPPDRLEAARASVGWQFVNLERTGTSTRPWAATLTRPNMRLDLGGIAKGYALDEAAKVLRQHGVKSFLVSGGGDIFVGEPPPGETGWRVEIAALDAPGAPPAKFVRLRNAALVTSGDFFQRVEIGGVRYSHIVDPRTGVGMTDHSLVTLIGPQAMTVDALSKVVSVLGPERGFELLGREFPGIEAMAVRQPGQVIESSTTPGFKRWLER